MHLSATRPNELWASTVSADAYLDYVLRREAIQEGPDSPIWQVIDVLAPHVSTWANGHLLSFTPSGSLAKGTANRSGTDIDLFISVAETAAETLQEVYDKLFNCMKHEGFIPLRKNVSINVRVNGYDVDLVPGKRQNLWSTDHSLYKQKARSWRQTNIDTHIQIVRTSGWADAMRVLKLWRHQWGLEFPSFHLELMVLNALWGKRMPLSKGVVSALHYIRDNIETARIVDPANTNNVVSDDLTAAEKTAIRRVADGALQRRWIDLVQ